jgi:hypothetical protein
VVLKKDLGAIQRKKRFTSFPSPAGMSLTKLPMGRNNSVMTSLFPPRKSLVVTSRLGMGNSRTFFYGVSAHRQTRIRLIISVHFFICQGLRLIEYSYICMSTSLSAQFKGLASYSRGLHAFSHLQTELYTAGIPRNPSCDD